MAQGRFISKSIAKDKRLNQMSVEAELLYLMAIPHLDRDGLINGDGHLLYSDICPQRTEFFAQMDSIVKEWIESGLVVAYEYDEGRVLWFRGFTKNQQGMRYDKEGASRFPPPPGYRRNGNGLETDGVRNDSDPQSGQGRDKVGSKSGVDEKSSENGDLHESNGTPDQVRSKSGVGRGKEEDQDKEEEEDKGSPPPHPPDSSQPTYGDVVACYQSNIGVITKHVGDMMADEVERLSPEWVMDAIGEAAKYNKRSWAYVEKVLRCWETEGRKGKTVQNSAAIPTTVKAIEGDMYV